MITQYVGPIGSGKSYGALEKLYAHLQKGLYVIANFPLNFTEGMIRRGYADRFMYVPYDFLEEERGVSLFLYLSEKYKFNEFTNLCLVVIDEVGGLHPPDQATSPVQKTWRDFYKESRKLGYDFIHILQDETEINRTISKCTEYKIVCRKANSIFPFKYLPFTIFVYIKYWKQSRQKLETSSSIFVKKFSQLYNTHQQFRIRKVDRLADLKEFEFDMTFGNCVKGESPVVDVALGG